MEKRKFYALDGLRALAFLMVVGAHCGLISSTIAIYIYIYLSGFLMYISYKDREIENKFSKNVKFAINKLKKLYPLYIITLIATIIFYVITVSSHLKFLIICFVTFVIDALYLQSWVPIQKIVLLLNGPSWYLSTAFFMYLVFPFVIKYIKKCNSIKEAIRNIVFIIIFQILVVIVLYRLNVSEELQWCLVYVNPLFRELDFITGCYLGYIFLNKKHTDSTIKISIIEIITIILFCLNIYIFKYVEFTGVLNTFALKKCIFNIPISLLMIYVFAGDKGIVSKFLAIKPISYLAKISMYGFLLHYLQIEPLRQLLMKGSAIFNNNITLFIINMIITIILCELYKLCESQIKKFL